MSDALTIYAGDGRSPSLSDEHEVIAVLGPFANRAWANRLARVPLLEDIVRRALTVRSFHQEVAIREEMAQLAAQFETCVCRRVVGPEERCSSCGACPICESARPCPEPELAIEAREYEAPVGVRY